MLPLCWRRSPAAPAAPMAAHARARAAPCCLPRSPAAILDTPPRPPMRARVRGSACRLDTSPELSTVPAGDPSGGDPGHVQTAPAPAAIPGGLLPNFPDGPRRAPAAPAPVRDPRHAAPRPWTRGPAPRPAPSRGRYAPQDATPTGLLLPRNAQRQRATHPRTPAPPRHAPRAPARPPRPCARVAPRTRSPARVRTPAFACRYCARDFPLSRAL